MALPAGAAHRPAGLCADVVAASPASGAAVQLYGCNSTDAQRRSAPADGSLRSLGKCLDVVNGGTANATPVQLWDCDGTATQQRASGTDARAGTPARAGAWTTRQQRQAK